MIPREDIENFWNHWEANKPFHIGVTSKSHCPIGLGGDDARYTLSGAKVVVICLNVILWDRQFHKATAPVDSSSV